MPDYHEDIREDFAPKRFARARATASKAHALGYVLAGTVGGIVVLIAEQVL